MPRCLEDAGALRHHGGPLPVPLQGQAHQLEARRPTTLSGQSRQSCGRASCEWVAELQEEALWRGAHHGRPQEVAGHSPGIQLGIARKLGSSEARKLERPARMS